MKGTTVTLNGDPWTVVDVAPAEPLAEMVAALLEDEGFVAVVRGIALLGDTLAHLGIGAAGASVVLVPEADAEAALALIAETVTDYEGDDLDAALVRLQGDPSALGALDPDDDELDDDELDDDDELRTLDTLEDEMEDVDGDEPAQR
jgi:hypothetical protein